MKKEAIALIDDDAPGISLAHIFEPDTRAAWEAELRDLTERLARKGRTHNMRIVNVTIEVTE